MVLFYCKTSQGSVIKSLIEVLKEIINDTNLYVTKDGLRILMTDSSQSCLVSMKLDSDNFDSFECNTEGMYLGINMLSCWKLLKSVSNNDTVTLAVNEDNEHELLVTVENLEKRSKTEYVLKLLDIDISQIQIPDVESKVVVTIPSVDLQRIMRDISNLSEYVSIEASQSSLMISCDGDFAKQCTTLGSAEHGLSFKYNGAPETISSSYNVRYINMFCKACVISPILELHMKPSYPLIIKFPLTLGVLQFALAPRMADYEED